MTRNDRLPDGWFAPCARCWHMGWVGWKSYYTKLPRFETDKVTPHECPGKREVVLG